ncbi:MAG TPA: hypothetical protein VFV62_01365 [Gaiellaceae bacterium]|nr:hypothetical protein [Gaiellaceae bacterium]
MTTSLQTAHDLRTPMSIDRDYWLSHCEGYRVDTADGRLGFVDEIRAGRDPDGDVLAVRAGVLGRRIVLVPVAEVEFVVPRAERIWLHSPVTIRGSEPVVAQQ